MILAMQRLFLYGHKQQYDAIMQAILQGGFVHVSSPDEINDYDKISSFVTRTALDGFSLDNIHSRVKNALMILSTYEEKKSMFALPPSMNIATLQDQQLLDQAEHLCDQIEEMQTNISEMQTQRMELKNNIVALNPWQGYTLDLAQKHTTYFSLCKMMMTTEVSINSMETTLIDKGFTCFIQQISQEADNQFFVVVCLRQEQVEVQQIIIALGGTVVEFSTFHGEAQENIENLTGEISALEDRIKTQEEMLKNMTSECNHLRCALDAIKIRQSLVACKNETLEVGDVFVLTGWIVETHQQDILNQLQSFDCCISFESPQEGDDPPIAFKNNKFVQNFEPIAAMYALPQPCSVDPNPTVSIFFALFFGMMFSDAGYGIVLMLLGFVLSKKLWFKADSATFYRMLGYCGIFTTVFGVIYGSFFGDMIPTVASVFFDKEIVLPALLNPINGVITILVISIALGAVHIFTGMGLKAYLLIKRNRPWDAVFDVGFWVIFLIGLPMIFLPDTLGTIGKYVAIVGLVGLVVTQGRHHKNPIMKVLAGVLSLYNLSGYLSDLLSYSRILALGLATAVIANVVNLLGGMSGKGIVGFVLFVVIFLVGHAINFALSALGAYVHTSRLQYVEFFSKFYESGGKPFAPLRAKTSYVLLNNKED